MNATSLIVALASAASVLSAQGRPAPRIVQSRVDWDSFFISTPGPALMPEILERYRRTNGIPLSFLARSNAPPEILATLKFAEQPCTRVIRAFVRTIPLDDPVLAPKPVVELNDKGQELRRWHMAVDEIVLAVRGAELIVPFWLERALLAITPDGGMRVVPDARYASPDSIPCPALEILKGSQHGRCWTFKDVATGAVRRLAYEVPCDAAP